MLRLVGVPSATCNIDVRGIVILTGMEGGLKSGQSVVLQHVEESLQ